MIKHLPVSHCCIRSDEARLWKCYTGWYPIIPAKLSLGDHECSGMTRLLVQSTRPHHTAALPLPSCARPNSVQTRRAGVPVCPWTSASLYLADALQPVAGLPVFIIDLGTG